ncbi:MAG: FAD-linked oxidase C-terminal domain-containing protein, partial [Pseudomonadota bacterium]
GLDEAFEYMPGSYIRQHLAKIAGARPPFEGSHEVNIMVELGATAPQDTRALDDGTVPLVNRLEETLAELMEQGLVVDAVVAKSDAQRAEMWQRREDAAEVSLTRLPLVNNDIAVPTDKVPEFFRRMAPALAAIDPEADDSCVAHLGDGNIHYTVFPTRDDPALKDAIMEAVE